MKIFKCKNKASNLITNQWDDSRGLDETYYEPSFGLPERQVPLLDIDGLEQFNELGELITETAPAEYSIVIEDIGNAPKWEKVRAIRDQLLSACDFTQISDTPITPEKRAEFAAYRTLLRDLPQTQTDPDNIVYPTKP